AASGVKNVAMLRGSMVSMYWRGAVLMLCGVGGHGGVIPPRSPGWLAEWGVPLLWWGGVRWLAPLGWLGGWVVRPMRSVEATRWWKVCSYWKNSEVVSA